MKYAIAIRCRPFFFMALITITITSCKKESHPAQPQNPPPEIKNWVVSSFAGNGQPFFADGPSQMASFRDPIDVAVSVDGIVYVADPITHRVRKIKDGIVSTLAGTGISGTAD